jgi:nucleotide-binding universal stress UspA family protein
VKTIVVGVDGSQHGDAALEFAAEEASLRGARLLIVCAWQIPMAFGPNAFYPRAWETTQQASCKRQLPESESCSRKSPVKARRSKAIQPLRYSKRPPRRF